MLTSRLSGPANEPVATSNVSLLSVAPYFRIPSTQARSILAGVESAVGRWRQTGRALGMTDLELDGFADAFERDERRIARRAIS